MEHMEIFSLKRHGENWDDFNEHGEGEPIKVKVLAVSPKSYYPDDADGGYVRKTRVIVPRGLADAVVDRAIVDYFSYSNCTHQHDCCGCSHTRAIATKIKNRTWLMTLHTGFNL
jgi:hypothetical protein